jgi:hypothetical protein
VKLTETPRFNLLRGPNPDPGSHFGSPPVSMDDLLPDGRGLTETAWTPAVEATP